MMNQTFPIIYKNTKFMVDPQLMSKSSAKFKELLLPYQNEGPINHLQLIIAFEEFTIRNVANFLKICQNLEADVIDSEMKQICIIAKLFKAEEIYNKGISFVHNYDPLFNVPNSYFGNPFFHNYLYIEKDGCQDEKVQLSENISNISEVSNNNYSEMNSSPADSERVSDIRKSKNDTFIVYELFSKMTLFALNKFFLVLKGVMIETAKQKDELIVIGKGNDVHISSRTENQIGKITRSEDSQFNRVDIESQSFYINYVDVPRNDHLSISLKFDNRGQEAFWSPLNENLFKDRENSPLLNGYFHHTPEHSGKNTILIDENGAIKYILRKMNESMFEIECEETLDPTIAFAIGISQLIKPYPRPFRA